MIPSKNGFKGGRGVHWRSGEQEGTLSDTEKAVPWLRGVGAVSRRKIKTSERADCVLLLQR